MTETDSIPARPAARRLGRPARGRRPGRARPRRRDHFSDPARVSDPKSAQIQSLAGLDADRVKDVVAAVWDHKDEVAGAVRFVREHGDDLVALAARLPALLAEAAEGLAGAGADARSAAAFLTGDGGKGGVKALAELAGDALQKCREELTAARGLLDDLGGELDRVPIPSVRPTYSDVLGHKLITGLDLTDGRLLEQAGKQVREGAARFDGVGEQLAKVADQLREIGALVERAGHGLAGTAAKLESGGKSLATLTDPRR